MTLSKYLPGARRARLGAASVGTLVLLVAIPGSAQAATAVGLGTADSFVVLAGTGVANTGPTTLSGDLGAANGSVTGAADITFASGVNHYGDGQTAGAMLDLETAFGAASQTADATISADLGDQSLVPGVYFQASVMNLSGPALTLDAGGNPDAVWIFRAGSSLVVGPGASVNLTNGAQACNVFWQVASTATLDDGAHFIGTIMARTQITLNAGATVEGRVLALDANVTLINNTITRPVCAAPQVAATPSGPVSTGDGSTSGAVSNVAYVVAGALAVAGFGGAAVLAVRRRRQDA